MYFQNIDLYILLAFYCLKGFFYGREHCLVINYFCSTSKLLHIYLVAASGSTNLLYLVYSFNNKAFPLLFFITGSFTVFPTLMGL